MKREILVLATAACLTLSVQAQNGATSNAFGAGQSGASTHAGTHAGATPHTAGPREQAARLGLRMLRETNEARTAVKSRNKLTADRDITEALASLEQARKDESGRMIPLYQEFSSVSVVAPVRAQQRQSGTAAKNGAAAANGTNTSSAQAGNGSQQSRPSHETVRDVTGQYSLMFIDTDGSRSNLDAARSAIAAGNWKQADAALAAVQDSVVFAQMEEDRPLARARQNLILARDAASAGHYVEARAALTSASHALTEYEQTGRSHASDAKSLQSDIQSYSQQITQSHADAVDKINGWWNTLAGWTQAAPSSSTNG
jgi:hypothetical protein